MPVCSLQRLRCYAAQSRLHHPAGKEGCCRVLLQSFMCVQEALQEVGQETPSKTCCPAACWLCSWGQVTPSLLQMHTSASNRLDFMSRNLFEVPRTTASFRPHSYPWMQPKTPLPAPDQPFVYLHLCLASGAHMCMLPLSIC